MQMKPMTARRMTATWSVAMLVALASAVHAAEPATPWPTNGWQTAAPEEQGMASAALADLVDFGAANAMDSLLVVRHGKIVLETYYAPFKPGMKHSVNSVTKGVVGTLVGLASADGKIESLDAPVLGFFAERKVADADARKKAMTLQHLLDSTSGLDWREPLTDEVPETMLQMERSSEWIDFVLGRPMAQPPGQAFNYDSGGWHLLSAIVARQAGVDTLEYARQRLFAPLGITDVAWRRDPQGVRTGGYGLYLQPRDMAKIGYLYLHSGEWSGRQLLPKSWVARTFRPTVDMKIGTLRYANGWWTVPEKDAHMAVGFLRQLIVVLPKLDLVAVATGRRHYPFDALIDRVAAAARATTALPADPEGSDRLARRVAAAAIEEPSAVGSASSLAASVGGRTYRFAPNPIGLRTMRLDLAPPNARYDISFGAAGSERPTRRFEGPLGLDGRFAIREARGDEPLLAVKGTWASDSTFRITARSVQDGIVTVYAVSFFERNIDVALEDNRGVRAQLRGEVVE